MRIADVTSADVDNLKPGLDRFLIGIGRVRLDQQGIDVERINARGGIAEAQLDLEGFKLFLAARGDELDTFFTRLRVLLFDDEKPIGSAGLLRTASDAFEVEHVTMGDVKEIVEGLRDLENLPGSDDSEARLIQVPQIYLSSLVLVRNGEFDSFLILTPPYPKAVAARTPNAFHQFVGQLLEEHSKIFPLT